MPDDEPTQDSAVLLSPAAGEGQREGEEATADDPRIAELTATWKHPPPTWPRS